MMNTNRLMDVIYEGTDESLQDPAVVCIDAEGNQYEVADIDLSAMPGVFFLKIEKVSA
jgi:hypothetical protein